MLVSVNKLLGVVGPSPGLELGEVLDLLRQQVKLNRVGLGGDLFRRMVLLILGSTGTCSIDLDLLE